jgi:hypothetical protein
MKKEMFDEWCKTSDELLQLIFRANEKELNEIPFEKSWTAAQVAEHLLKSYGIVEVLKASQTKSKRAADEKVAQLKDFFLNFNLKANAAPAILPSENQIDKEKLLDSLKSRIEEIKEVIKTKDLSEVCETVALPVFGSLTKVEWLYLVFFHTQRHIHQIKNILKILNKQEISKSISEF